jgi:predicted N-acetyltransferase YhbS
MDHLSIRPFEEGDLDFACEMNTREQWNDTKADIERMFNYEPKGCFIAEARGLRAAHVFTVNYGRLGWIGLLIVKPEYRKMGIATLLMKKAIDYLLHCNVKTVKLEAALDIASLYRKLGFIDEYDSLRFIRKHGRTASHQSSYASSIQNDGIIEIAQFDAEYFGANRTRVLTSIHREFPQLSFVSYSGSEVVGYIMCRKANRGYNIGPFVCNPEEPQIPRNLLAKCMQKLGSRTSIYLGFRL